MDKLADVRKQRAVACDQFTALAEKDLLTPDEVKSYDGLKAQIAGFDGQIARIEESRATAAKTAQPVRGQETVAATVENDRYMREKSLVVGGIMRMLGKGGGSLREARLDAIDLYGEGHLVTRALMTGTGPAGGFILPPDYMNEIIELLRPKAVVRGANPRVIPMPRGTMTLPGQASPAVASYGTETQAIAASQQTLQQIVASFKKLTALVPVTNDMMRYADPAVDAFVRDDLVKVIALREDLAFLMGDGTLATPRGYISFANGYVAAQGGALGLWSSTANSTAAVGGNFITSNETFTEATVVAELTGAINRLDTANVPDEKRCWFMHPRAYNYLFGLLNSLGLYVFRDELTRGTLYGYPFKKTTQIPVNIWDTSGTNKDCSFIFLAEMTETMILDSMSMELAVSRDGSYVDASGNTQSAFASDQTLIRAIAEHDFQLRHDASVAVLQFVRWAPAIS